MSFERRDCVTTDEYLRMIRGKTAALVKCPAIDEVYLDTDSDEMADLARDPAAGERARNLVEGALALGSRDNATAIVQYKNLTN